MRSIRRIAGVVLAGVLCAGGVSAQDWPQWRGPNRDNKVTGFTAPDTWPKPLTQKWKTTVGLGDASPVLVGDRVYTFTRQGDDEMITSLDAASGKVVWQDKYAAEQATEPRGQHPGPRSTPAVGEGKICTLGVRGVLSCLDAAGGKVLWRKDTKVWPQFFTSASPVIAEGKCIAFLGGRGKGDLGAFDLTGGESKWEWKGEAPAYGSPVLLTVDGTQQVVALGAKSLVGVALPDGKLLWQVPYTSRYNSCTPVIDGQTIICSCQGGGTAAFKVEKQGDGFTAKELWKKEQAAGIYNTPVLKDGLLYGLTSGAGGGRGGAGGGGRRGGGRGGMGGATTNIFCMDAKTGDVLWTDKTPRGECGEIFDAGSVLLALSSNSELLAFKPSKKEYEEVARIKVADSPTWAYPVISGNRVFVKDRDALILWTIP